MADYYDLDALAEAHAYVFDSAVLPPRDIVTLWRRIKQVHDDVGVLVRGLAEAAAEAMLGEVGPGGEWTTTDGEVVHLERRYGSTRWDGYEIASRLATLEVIDHNGEVVPAVPLDYVRRFVPGAGSRDPSSARWNTTGLGEVIPDWRRLRDQLDPTWSIARGPRR